MRYYVHIVYNVDRRLMHARVHTTKVRIKARCLNADGPCSESRLYRARGEGSKISHKFARPCVSLIELVVQAARKEKKIKYQHKDASRGLLVYQLLSCPGGHFLARYLCIIPGRAFAFERGTGSTVVVELINGSPR